MGENKDKDTEESAKLKDQDPTQGQKKNKTIPPQNGILLNIKRLAVLSIMTNQMQTGISYAMPMYYLFTPKP